ncbi:hypothetical protein F7725_013550 [Dissostichus mawsoni]|uniref:Uncharacterized protein n=1 Tax=Dissostichus mawsoni TaxID=36200 RepID=A0A7J5Y667_DISMA|nr:hypothetical protein F7725_013550 [Dissostichus mawsoni]
MSRRRPCSVRRCWVHPILRKRLQRGEYHVLVQELRLDDHLFQQYFRMSKDVFDELLGKVGPLITKVDTCMRLSIGPAERLAICLRYLATGDSYRTIAFSYRVGHATVAVIVKEVAGDEAFPLMDNLLLHSLDVTSPVKGGCSTTASAGPDH